MAISLLPRYFILSLHFAMVLQVQSGFQNFIQISIPTQYVHTDVICCRFYAFTANISCRTGTFCHPICSTFNKTSIRMCQSYFPGDGGKTTLQHIIKNCAYPLYMSTFSSECAQTCIDVFILLLCKRGTIIIRIE